MRFLKVLTEQTDGLFTVTVDNEEFFDIKKSVIDRINKDCSQIIVPNTDLHSAIISRCELMFSCDFYYIIEVDDVGLTNLNNTRIEYFGFGR